MADLGNPNFFKVFKGRFAVRAPSPSVPEPFVMLSCVNDVQFLNDYTADADGLVCTLPELCRPNAPVRIPVVRIDSPSVYASQRIEVAVKTGELTIANYLESVEIESPAKADSGMTASQYDSYSTKTATAVDYSVSEEVSVPVVENKTIEIDGGSGSAASEFITVNPDGAVLGTPLAEYALNGVSFHISGNYYA